MQAQTANSIYTQQFGELQLAPNYVFHFPEGVFGFDELREFVLVGEEETLPFRWLISVENPDIGFPILSPWLVDLNYRPGKNYSDENLVLFVIVTLENEDGVMTANLKAPLVLDVDSHTGSQVILTSDKYSPRHVIVQNQKQLA